MTKAVTAAEGEAGRITTQSLNAYFRQLLNIDYFAKTDISMNGLQVDNDGSAIKKVAFAVDACMETFKAAKECGAGMVFVHHGLFWGHPLVVSKNHRERLNFLLENNLALYAVHLPLDAHSSLGNNAVLCKLLCVENPQPFGEYHGIKIGYKGTLKEPLTIKEAVSACAFMERPPLSILPFGKEKSISCAVVSGGAAMECEQAIEEGIDLYVTGEGSHQIYHQAKENKLNFIALGHYNSEVWGLRAIMEQMKNGISADNTTKTNFLETEFVDIPTNL
ncbi:MAG: Nif3-like dinuclear metal center hexameric protein [Termitinemataceae bacterium]|nr:MAG: Nif3-like dinuclear metal center hexameric protein [Termitinemataceae bacterium]